MCSYGRSLPDPKPPPETIDGMSADFPEPATQIALDEKRPDEMRKPRFADKPPV